MDLGSTLDALANVFTIGAIIIGGFWTWRLYGQKRQQYPRAGRSLSPEYTFYSQTV